MTHNLNLDFTSVLPIEICDEIFSYLPIKDLLTASLACKSLFEIIGKSDTFRKRVTINISNLNGKFDLEKPLSKNRIFENICIRTSKLPSDRVLHLLKNHQWKKMYFNVSKIKSQKHFKEFLTKNFPHLKELKVMNVMIELLSPCVLSLDNLECLIFSDVTLDVFEVFMTLHPKLKSVSLRYMYADTGHPSTVGDEIVRFLKLNPQVMNMKMDPYVVDRFFASDVSQNLMDLKFKFISINLNNTVDAVRNNLEIFLRAQGESLHELRLNFNELDDDDELPYFGPLPPRSSTDLLAVFSAWNYLKNLDKLTLKFFYNSESLDINRNVLKTMNYSLVKEVKIVHGSFSIPIAAIMELLRFAPNIRKIYVSQLTLPLMRFLAINFNLLRLIEYTHEKGDCKKEYLDMINTNKCDNKFIKFSQAYYG